MTILYAVRIFVWVKETPWTNLYGKMKHQTIITNYKTTSPVRFSQSDYKSKSKKFGLI